MAQLCDQETNIVIPRNYGVVIQSGTNNCFYDPARYVIGHVILCTQPQLAHMLRKWQAFKNNENEQKERGTLSYDPKFPVDGIEELLTCPVEDVEGALLGGIQKTEGSKNLWVVGGKDSIKGTKLYGRSLKASIKSKSSGYNDIHINNPFLGIEGIINHSDIYCSAPEGNYESQKYLRVMCAHAAALETANFMQLKKIRDFSINYGSRNTKYLEPTLVFDFVSNPFLSNLEIDVLIAHYIKGETFYSINRRLVDILEPYSAALNRTGDVGKARFAVMRQKTLDEGRSRSYQLVENRWARRIRGKIKELGYKRMPFYTIVLKDSPFEMIAERYESENGHDSVELAFSYDHAPLVIKKTFGGDVNFHSSAVPHERNPFANLVANKGEVASTSKPEDTIDDCTRRHCKQQTFVPISIPISKKMLSVYSRLSREARAEEKEKKQLDWVF